MAYHPLCSFCILYQTGRPGFDPRQRQMFFPVASVSGPALETHPASYPVGTFLGGKVKPLRTLTTHSHVVPRSRMTIIYSSPPHWRLYGGRGQLFTYYGCICSFFLLISSFLIRPI
jgi:hypothetical protein